MTARTTEELSDRIHDWRLVVRLARYLGPSKWSVVAVTLLSLLNAPLATAGPLLTKAAIDLFLAPDPLRPPSGYVLGIRHAAGLTGMGGSGHRGLFFVAMLYLLAMMAQSTVQYLQIVVIERVGQNTIHDLRLEMFGHLQTTSIQFYDRNPVGRLMTRLTTDLDAINEMLSAGMITIFGNLAMALYVTGWMFRINGPLALVSCATLLSMALFTAWFRKASRPAFRRFRERIAALNAFLQEHLSGMQIIQMFTREVREMEKFKRLNEEHRMAAMSVVFRNALVYPAIEAMALTGIALIIWYGGGQVMREAISIGSLVAFIQLAQSFYDPVTEVSSKYHLLQTAMPSAERIFGLLDEPATIPSPGVSSCAGGIRGRIEFRNVWFAYQDDDWVLKDVSFIIEPGQKVAFVGRTGSGKSTIANLLLRFYEIQRGQILLDDVDIRRIGTEQIRLSFGFVPQDIFLFSGDIASNIRLGNQAISDERIRMAAREVHIDSFIMKLERGYQTEVLERGAGLSVGQKQLVGFARALAFDRPILILDEATSSIDTQTETQIRDAVRRIMKGRTALIIAHRLSTIQSADRIIVMHKGEVRESGDHRSLIARKGLYRRLYELQFQRGEQDAEAKTMADD